MDLGLKEHAYLGDDSSPCFFVICVMYALVAVMALEVFVIPSVLLFVALHYL